MNVLPFSNESDIAVVGWACRVPGANSVEELWSLLRDGKCAVTSVPADRFPLERYGHPKRSERGRSYTWAAGVIDNIWEFDPSVFGISPREAVQMDPQQRLLLQLTWEALEDAGIRPSTIAGTEVGVYMGACQVEYSHRYGMDESIGDSHFATGTSLAVISNRISYIFDFHGPSMTIDTACSSSMVALHEAVAALRSGRIDTAIVGGVNIIASPGSFIAFSQASMLSPTGLCQAFSANADGFVRAEGAGVLILQNANRSDIKLRPIHGYVVATDVNSDGRTTGISLPSLDGQEALLKRLYRTSGVDPNRLAFVEAHGTGTAAGDPIEATALGHCLGLERSNPLIIGSIKTNIGHLEPAAGVAGLIKAFLALNHGVLPPSLHFNEPSAHIAFDELNLAVCDKVMLLPNAATQLAGVNSFGFGGTNAHAIIGPGKKPVSQSSVSPQEKTLFMLSAATKPALAELARDYSAHVANLSKYEITAVANAVVHRRERLGERLVVSADDGAAISNALSAYAADQKSTSLVSGSALGEDLPVAFVFSGNGSQWVGMGRSALASNPRFASHFDALDKIFTPLGGWSLREMLFSKELEEKLQLTRVAQPLLFAIQSSANAELRSRGFSPIAVLGHSVGEIAAAEAAGILSSKAAIELVIARSIHQESVRGQGRMRAVRASASAVEEMLESVEGLEVAAYNSPRSVTIAGAADKLALLAKKYRRVPMVDLELEYPFHSHLMESIRTDLAGDLDRLSAPENSKIAFISTVTGKLATGADVGGDYWWRNVREPVQFEEAVRTAKSLGARVFIEVGPRPVLVQHISDILEDEAVPAATITTLERDDGVADPFDRVVGRALVVGAEVNIAANFGRDPGPSIDLPKYPWQKKEFRFQHTTEAIGGDALPVPLIGMRLSADGLDWRSNIDTALYPDLADHRLGNQIVLPGTAYVEIALSVARQWLGVDNPVLNNLEFLRPLDLSRAETIEVMTRISPSTNTLEILSRPRLTQGGWTVHARCSLSRGHGALPSVPQLSSPRSTLRREEVYHIAADAGLNYGPSFQLVEQLNRFGKNLVEVQLPEPPKSGHFALDPVRLDCCLHAMFAVFPELQAKERGVAYIPVRIDRISLYQPNAMPARAVVEIVEKNPRAILANYYIFDSSNQLIALLYGARGQAIQTRHQASLNSMGYVETSRLLDASVLGHSGIAIGADELVARAKLLKLTGKTVSSASGEEEEIEKWAVSASYEIVRSLSENDVVDCDRLAGAGVLAEQGTQWLEAILSHLKEAGLARRRGAVWSLVQDAHLPDSRTVLRGIAEAFPQRAPILALAGWVADLSSRFASLAKTSEPVDVALPTAVLDFYESANVLTTKSADCIFQLLDGYKAFWPEDRALRVLLVGHGPLTAMFASSKHAQNVQLTVYEPNRRSYDRAETYLASGRAFKLVGDDKVDGLQEYDLVISATGLSRILPRVRMEWLQGLIAPRGLFVAIEATPSLFADLVFGGLPGWWAAESTPAEGLLGDEAWTRHLKAAGFKHVKCVPLRGASFPASLVLAEQGEPARKAEAKAPANACGSKSHVCVLTTGDRPSTDFADTLAKVLTKGKALSSTSTRLVDPVDAKAGQQVVYVGPGRKLESSQEALIQRCNDMKTAIEQRAEQKPVVWMLFWGALPSESTVTSPVEAGAWAFSRVLSNEYPNVIIKRIDVAANTLAVEVSEQIRTVLLSGTDETEFQIDKRAIRTLRVHGFKSFLESGLRGAQKQVEAVTLRRQTHSRQRVVWEAAKRQSPARGEVEIAVEATGLNFRDLMWTMSLLPDDMLEDGFTGPALGLECSGVVVRVGASVKGIQLGDRVVCLAANSFGTHVTVKAAQVAVLPAGVSLEAGATMPVAFLTAYYSLIKQAKLVRGETILIHGGAGAVGLAAIQIAKWRGARVIATAGSPAKRSLLTALGVDHVLDSRSTQFVEEVASITGAGVDVVLNSLAGEAMEASIGCLRPFGRFVELGKRDYVTNTNVGLRPFRKNLSYFGVDLDQLMVGRPAFAKSLFAELMGLFERGVFKPLPFSSFRGEDVNDAFQLMLESHHIGKIVIRPPDPSVAWSEPEKFVPNAKGTHVITGAFGGFGMEAARWLANQGVRNLALYGRSGAATPAARDLLADLEGRGVTVRVRPLDITDLAAVQSEFEAVQELMPPIVGILHAAMVLEDSMSVNLDFARFQRVLQPKVQGTLNLDSASKALPLDYFVLFSSITTLIGNRGQGNYVAANAFMEGVARNLRLRGVPALAIGWGAISDVGVAATNEKARSQLGRLTQDRVGNTANILAAMGLRAHEALDLMGDALMQAASRNVAVMTISAGGGLFRKETLPILSSPTFENFVTTQRDTSSMAFDLAALLQDGNTDGIRRKILEIVTGELAKVLHSRPEEISHTRPLGELGLDSLMTLELALELEGLLGRTFAFARSVGSITVPVLVDEIIAQIATKDGDEPPDSPANDVVQSQPAKPVEKRRAA
jgi:phthiocerol/phenolphthiocerol synthesis type-I polyketide synthase C